MPVNHSTNIKGLLMLLKKLEHRLAEKQPSSPVHSIFMGRIAHTRGHSKHFKLRLTTCTERGFKALARKGSRVQEVFFVGGNKGQIESAIRQELGPDDDDGATDDKHDNFDDSPESTLAQIPDQRTLEVIRRFRQSLSRSRPS
jgi:hypothetical protein